MEARPRLRPGSSANPVRIPRAIIIPGVRKSGTTSLHAALSAQDGLVAGRHKETQFFALDEQTVRDHLSWYVEQFGGRRVLEEKPALDASTFYFMSGRAPALIRRYITDARIVIAVRDPAQRAFSAYQYMRQRVPSPEGRDFAHIVGHLEESGVSGVTAAEDELIVAAVREGRLPARYYGASFHAEQLGAPFATRLEDPNNIFRYFTESCYSGFVTRYERSFPGRVLVVAFERLIAEPERCLSEILAFCGQPGPSVAAELPRENPTRPPRGRAARRVLRMIFGRPRGGPLDRLLALTRDLGLNEMVRERILSRRRERLDPDLERRCRDILADEYTWWEERDPAIVAWWRRDPAGFSGDGPRRAYR